MLNWLSENITLPLILAFVLGMLASEGIMTLVNRWRRAKQQDKSAKASSVNVIVAVVILLTMLWIMVSVQQARDCAININISVSREQDAATIERNSFQHAIQESLSLPPDIQALPTNDPRRKALTDPITAEYLKQLDVANQIRKSNQAAVDKARKACGQ